MTDKQLTAERLRELLSYDCETGDFVWLQTRGRLAVAGAIAGHVNKLGYRILFIDGKGYKAHRLAWLYSYGYFPQYGIDHINGDCGCNILSNLRDISQALNNQNIRQARKDNSTGVLGVTKDRNKFAARVGVNGKVLYIGSFDTVEDAHSAYLTAKRSLHSACSI